MKQIRRRIERHVIQRCKNTDPKLGEVNTDIHTIHVFSMEDKRRVEQRNDRYFKRQDPTELRRIELTLIQFVW